MKRTIKRDIPKDYSFLDLVAPSYNRLKITPKFVAGGPKKTSPVVLPEYDQNNSVVNQDRLNWLQDPVRNSVINNNNTTTNSYSGVPSDLLRVPEYIPFLTPETDPLKLNWLQDPIRNTVDQSLINQSVSDAEQRVAEAKERQRIQDAYQSWKNTQSQNQPDMDQSEIDRITAEEALLFGDNPTSGGLVFNDSITNGQQISLPNNNQWEIPQIPANAQRPSEYADPTQAIIGSIGADKKVEPTKPTDSKSKGSYKPYSINPFTTGLNLLNAGLNTVGGMRNMSRMRNQENLNSFITQQPEAVYPNKRMLYGDKSMFAEMGGEYSYGGMYYDGGVYSDMSLMEDVPSSKQPKKTYWTGHKTLEEYTKLHPDIAVQDIKQGCGNGQKCDSDELFFTEETIESSNPIKPTKEEIDFLNSYNKRVSTTVKEWDKDYGAQDCIWCQKDPNKKGDDLQRRLSGFTREEFTQRREDQNKYYEIVNRYKDLLKLDPDPIMSKYERKLYSYPEETVVVPDSEVGEETTTTRNNIFKRLFKKKNNNIEEEEDTTDTTKKVPVTSTTSTPTETTTETTVTPTPASPTNIWHELVGDNKLIVKGPAIKNGVQFMTFQEYDDYVKNNPQHKYSAQSNSVGYVYQPGKGVVKFEYGGAYQEGGSVYDLDSYIGELVQYKKGGIYIKPENKGKFTAWAQSHGMSVQEAASHVMANKEKYSSTTVKRANFAKNASKWKKEKGGEIDNDKEMVDGVADILSRVNDVNNRKELARYMTNQFNDEDVDYDYNQFLEATNLMEMAYGGMYSYGGHYIPQDVPYLAGKFVPNPIDLEILANGGMIKRADGTYSKRGLWDNIRANKGSGKKPTKEMLKQERKIKKGYKAGGEYMEGNEYEISGAELDRLRSLGYDVEMI